MSDVQVDFENDIQKKDHAFQKQAAHNTTNVFFHGQGFFLMLYSLLSKNLTFRKSFHICMYCTITFIISLANTLWNFFARVYMKN